MSRTDRSERNREAQAKLAQKRVQNVEKHFGMLCETVGSITRKSARLRDKGDLLAHQLTLYAESDELNSTTRYNILHFAENYSAVQDYCHAKVQRIETKVLKPLTRYGELCRYVKRNIKSEIAACGKEKKAKQKLEKLQAKGDNEPQVAELELDRVQAEEQLVGEAMELELDKFEKEKLEDVKNILTELVKIEMVYHAKALEYLSKCFENMQQISVEGDLADFRTAMVKVGNTSQEDTSARSQKSAQKVRIDASTLTSTGSTRRSMDTRASGTLSSSGLSSISRSQKSTQFQQPAPSRQPYQVQPSPRARQNMLGRQSPHVRISSAAPKEYYRMYQDDDDSDDDYDD